MFFLLTTCILCVDVVKKIKILFTFGYYGRIWVKLSLVDSATRFVNTYLLGRDLSVVGRYLPFEELGPDF